MLAPNEPPYKASATAWLSEKVVMAVEHPNFSEHLKNHYSTLFRWADRHMDEKERGKGKWWCQRKKRQKKDLQGWLGDLNQTEVVKKQV